MGKTVVIIMAAGVLFCMSPQLKAQVYEIPVKVVNGEIDMGERYAYAVPQEATIKWTCDYSFEVVFDHGAPFEATKPIPALETSRPVKVIQKKARPEAITYFVYKYTIVVAVDNRLVTLDPVIIVVPPKR
jgi:hypothetical protein